ncbi:hypothetical protein CAPTEDRAFT_155466 [Capitella teleta]|uniref:Polypeptide N-acetylgalactosaminyltransferase n=1 Tax=Capitella teleta TaxID=283909 RepID=R7T425_CAPTE|nr:hypothetical protein CAPTEDRAFT_155466 [Capitella teleta]|eukprot:ELT87486.1 hypothetical protein CAPTEDRAFT_155466 [Capitella teleta]
MAGGLMKKVVIGVSMVTIVWFVLIVTYLSDLGKTERFHGILRHPREARIGLAPSANQSLNFEYEIVDVESLKQDKLAPLFATGTSTAHSPELNEIDSELNGLANELHVPTVPSNRYAKSYNVPNKSSSPATNAYQDNGFYDKLFINKTVIDRGRAITRDEFLDLESGMQRHSFNVRASELLPLDRPIPDYRPTQCPSINQSTLSPTTVIICFHNEAWSTLLRTLHSVINRSPSHLIMEIILVDDASTFDYLGEPLENHLSQLENVYLLRTKIREGLIRARLLGVSYAKGDVLVFLDSHCECAEGWLPPLLLAIEADRTKIVCPLVDVIEFQTFEYRAAKEELHGAFDWNLQFIWKDLPEHEMKRRTSPADNIRAPTIIGGLFAVDRLYFKRIGSYDSGMDIWGSENLELSFRVWMCGGSLEISPCSRVGHVFRTRIPYGFPNGGKRTIRNNAMRAAEVWLDDYKKFFYASQNITRRLTTVEDVVVRVDLRRKLKCKSFQWYLDNVIPEAVLPEDEDEYFGQIQSLASPSKCLEFKDNHLTLSHCKSMKESQMFHLTNQQLLKRDDVTCFDVNGRDLITRDCEISQTIWRKADDNSIRGEEGKTIYCLKADGSDATMENCERKNIHQKWSFSHHFNQQKLNLSYE